MHKTVGTFRILSAEDSNGIIYNRNLGIICTMPRLVLFRMIEWIVAKSCPRSIQNTYNRIYNKEKKRTCLFLVIKQCVVVRFTDISGQPIVLFFKRQGLLTTEYEVEEVI